eukprot:m.203247 g.203247  ORF g.203247 m.203247 type:complete len:471 (-) comp14987_c3_seq1:304-1716(-)
MVVTRVMVQSALLCMALLALTHAEDSCSADGSCDAPEASALNSEVQDDVMASMFTEDLDSWPTIYRQSSEWQKLEIIVPPNPEQSDVCLVLDDTLQICNSYDPHYHEMFVHFPITYLEKVEYVLIIGGGDAMALNEALKYNTVKKVVQLELDRMVPEVCAQHFDLDPFLDGTNDRVEWIFGDAGVTLKNLKERGMQFDLIVMDVSETANSNPIVTDAFVDAATAVLADTGIFVKNEDYQKLVDRRFKYFLEVQYELPMIVTQTFCLGSQSTSLLLPNFKLLRESEIETKFYSPDRHSIYVRHYNAKLGLDQKFYGMPERDLFVDVLTNSESERHPESFLPIRTKNLAPLEKQMGHHLIVEFSEIENLEALRNATVMNATISTAVEAGELTVVHQYAYQFEPYGVTAVAILTESHLAIHTWPEMGYAAIDLFTCGDANRPDNSIESLYHDLSPRSVSVTYSPRGVAADMVL